MSNGEIAEQGSGEVVDVATATETTEQGFNEVVDDNGSAATRVLGTLVDYLLAWNAPEQLYYQDMNAPIKFAFSRADGDTLLLDDADTLSLSVTKPDGSSVDAGVVKVSSVEAASIEVAAMYQFGEKDTHVFELTIVHDAQEIIARKTLIVY